MAKVIIKTTEGDIKVRLYDETPQHRDNFIKLAKEGYFDGTLFHRVIKDFMIQGGDPDSKGAPKGKMLGTGGPDYTIPAEFVYPQLFHKRGAIQILDDATIEAMKTKRARDMARDEAERQKEAVASGEQTDWQEAMKQWNEYYEK